MSKKSKDKEDVKWVEFSPPETMRTYRWSDGYQEVYYAVSRLGIGKTTHRLEFFGVDRSQEQGHVPHKAIIAEGWRSILIETPSWTI